MHHFYPISKSSHLKSSYINTSPHYLSPRLRHFRACVLWFEVRYFRARSNSNIIFRHTKTSTHQFCACALEVNCARIPPTLPTIVQFQYGTCSYFINKLVGNVLRQYVPRHFNTISSVFSTYYLYLFPRERSNW